MVQETEYQQNDFIQEEQDIHLFQLHILFYWHL